VGRPKTAGLVGPRLPRSSSTTVPSGSPRSFATTAQTSSSASTPSTSWTGRQDSGRGRTRRLERPQERRSPPRWPAQAHPLGALEERREPDRPAGPQARPCPLGTGPRL